MTELLYVIALLPLWAYANYVRGGALYEITDRLPGRALYYVAGFYAFSIWPISNWVFALVVGLGYAIAMAPGWGLWFDLGREPDHTDARRSDLFVRIIDKLGMGNDFAALWWRHTICVVPFILASAWLVGKPVFPVMIPIYGIIIVCTYELGHRYGKHARDAELMTGVIWWMMCTMLSANL